MVFDEFLSIFELQILIKKKADKWNKWIPLCCTLGAVWIIIILYYRRVKFKSNDRYHCIRKTILNGDDLSA
ncbi:Uncharacterized protein FWK35_00004034 [Aphis craccivora]|uniref:Uncharacterized protein n=1 Tax=Aphis craccivora TaxID=307492 RepID=A0A6G0Z717_APHCR|nr:Uncharacterized protein FWK35_00004034 [Aphis craccivora]